MATIVTRAGKGSPLTNTEVDSNFTNLNSGKQEVLAEGSFADGDKTKLDGIESGADVTDTANVEAAGALMDSEVTNLAQVKAFSSADYATAAQGSTADSALQNVIEDTTPQLGGNLDTNGKYINKVDLEAISASISDTAVDVFVYDTRKDSDGGAWRKRCQHTSWYNETLNTSTRGSRKEFPAVAVIVAESNQLTIYDGDDPDMPMWMVFNQGGTWNTTCNLLTVTSAAISSISALNGFVSVGLQSGYGFLYFSLVSEYSADIFANNVTKYNGNIEQRNDGLGHSSVSDTRRTVNSVSNDVAMTVLPNAPIDDATGLPIPTIAVATDGGVSVIKDDGSVVDLTTTSQSNKQVSSISLDGEYIAFSDELNARAFIIKIPSSDISATYNESLAGVEAYTDSTVPTISKDATSAYDPDFVINKGNNFYIGQPSWLSTVSRNAESKENGMVNYITSSYNTGWMNGDIKLATLSDTDDTDVTGSELVTNGTFDTDTSGWSVLNTGTFTVSSGQATLSDSDGTGTSPVAYQAVSLVVGKTYVLSYDTLAAREAYAFMSQTAGSNNQNMSIQGYTGSRTGTQTITFVANATSMYVNFNDASGSDFDITIDNVSVRLAEEDRSVNGNGLQVFGTVTKNPVATGADLVAYSGWSSSNYLEQPVTSHIGLDSTDDVFMTCWAKVTSSSGIDVLMRTGVPSGGQARYIYIYNGEVCGDTYGDTLNSGVYINDGSWHHIAITYLAPNGRCLIYVDGKLVKSEVPSSGYVDQTGDYGLTIGTDWNQGNIYQGSIALARLSNTAPTAEQILKIYNDEKYLFQENAQATLYGSSDAVTALAYDNDTNLLHVGTSAGRSDFNGLRRVNNTTDAVGAAISASNGLIAED